MSKWQCKRCRDRGEIPTAGMDGCVKYRPCPEFNEDGAAFDDRPRAAVQRTDNGDGLPPNYAREYAGN